MNKLGISWARWITLLVLVLMTGFGLNSIISWNSWLGGVTAVFMAIVLTFAVEFWLRNLTLHPTEEKNTSLTNTEVSQEYAHTKIAINSLRTLLQVHSEKEILELTMQTGMELMGMSGASFIPYDEWGQSLPALFHGMVSGPALQSWAQRLSLPETRQTCKNCQEMHGSAGCILLSSATILPTEVICFPLTTAGREVGVFNFYHETAIALNTEVNVYFAEILDAAGKALENIQIRNQEIAALHYLQTITSPKSDLSELLNSVLENVQIALDVDFAILYVPGGVPGQINITPQFFIRKKGQENVSTSIPDLPFMEGIWKSVLASGETLSLANVSLNKQEKWKTLLAVPLIWRGAQASGVLLLGSNNTQLLAQRHQALLETLAGQAALLIQNARLMVQVEYQAVVDERTRLAREIHDGLAQTLAFLKIQAAQMQNFLARGETEKLTNTLQANYRTLSDAYIDARQAIDNLRRVPTNNLHDWISLVAADFEQVNNQKVSVNIEEFSSEYPANIQAQLIRIVQEALSNVRKHSDATQVNIVGIYEQDSYLIEIQDNGRGFSPLDGNVDGSSHYGLRGMRERSEGIGADFQITSQPGQGTRVSVRVPLLLKEEL